jgi:hypothetical protein
MEIMQRFPPDNPDPVPTTRGAMETEDFDKNFDQGESVIDDLDLSKARRPEKEQRNVSSFFAVDAFAGLIKQS